MLSPNCLAYGCIAPPIKGILPGKVGELVYETSHDLYKKVKDIKLKYFNKRLEKYIKRTEETLEKLRILQQQRDISSNISSG